MTNLKNHELKNLPDADFRYQDLQNAKFRWAYLHRADFTNANLRGVDFSDTDLREANFTGADITGAVFDRALMSDTCFDEEFPIEAVYATATKRTFRIFLTKTVKTEIEVEAVGENEAENMAIALVENDEDYWEIEDIKEVA